MPYLPYAIALATGLAVYWLSKPLGWIAALIGLGSVIAILACRRMPHETPTGQNLRIAFLACILFTLAGFTAIAYPSALQAYDYYGDFHDGGAADARYADALTRPWNEAPLFGLFFREAKTTKTFIDFAHPPASELDHRTNATEAVIFINIISRVLGLIAFFMIIRGSGATPMGAIAALLIFTFQYTNIALTQSMKFVAGFPFFMLWILSFLRYEKTRERRTLILHLACIPPLLVSQQWIMFFVASFYLLYPAFKYATGGAIRRFEVLGTLAITLASVTLYVIEHARFMAGDVPLIPIVPSAFRSPYLTEYPTMALFALAALLVGVVLFRRTPSFPGKTFVTLFITPIALFSRALIFLHPSVFLYPDFLAFIGSYWLLVSLALYALIAHIFADRHISPLSLCALFAWFVSSLPPLLLACGVSIPTSPVLDVIITPLLVLASITRESRIAYAITALVLLTLPLSIYKLVIYTNAFDRMIILIPLIIAPLALMLAERYRHA